MDGLVLDFSPRFATLSSMHFKSLKQIRADKFVIICAWCEDSKEATSHYESIGYEVSHGICPACLEKFKGDSLKGSVLDLSTVCK